MLKEYQIREMVRQGESLKPRLKEKMKHTIEQLAEEMAAVGAKRELIAEYIPQYCREIGQELVEELPKRNYRTMGAECVNWTTASIKQLYQIASPYEECPLWLKVEAKAELMRRQKHKYGRLQMRRKDIAN